MSVRRACGRVPRQSREWYDRRKPGGGRSQAWLRGEDRGRRKLPDDRDVVAQRRAGDRGLDEHRLQARGAGRDGALFRREWT